MQYNIKVEVLSITCSDTEDVASGGDEIYLDVDLAVGPVQSQRTTATITMNSGSVATGAPFGTLLEACQREETERITGRVRLMDDDWPDPDDCLGEITFDLAVGITPDSPPVQLITANPSKGGWWSSWNYVVVLQVTRVPSLRGLLVTVSPESLTRGVATALLVTAKDPLDPGRAITGDVQVTPDLTGGSGWTTIGSLGTPFSFTAAVAGTLLGRLVNLSPPACFTYQAADFQISVLPPFGRPGDGGALSPALQELLEWLRDHGVVFPVRLPAMTITYTPPVIVKNVPTQVQVFAKHATALSFITGGRVWINGVDVGETSTPTNPRPFSYTFTGPTTGVVKAAGYQDASFAFNVTP